MNLKDEYFLKRRHKGISQGELAKYLNCSQSLISRYEKSDCGMSEEKIFLYRKYIDTYKK